MVLDGQLSSHLVGCAHIPNSRSKIEGKAALWLTTGIWHDVWFTRGMTACGLTRCGRPTSSSGTWPK